MNRNFKKDGSDPTIDKGEQGRFAWSGGFNFGPTLMSVLGTLFPGTANDQPEDHLRYRRGGSGRKHIYRKRPNRLIISKRVRRKHRRRAA